MEEPASEGALDAREGVAAVDEVASADVGIDSFAGGMDGQGIEVVAEDFCAEVLLCGHSVPSPTAPSTNCVCRARISSGFFFPIARRRMSAWLSENPATVLAMAMTCS